MRFKATIHIITTKKKEKERSLIVKTIQNKEIFYSLTEEELESEKSSSSLSLIAFSSTLGINSFESDNVIGLRGGSAVNFDLSIT